MNTCVLLLAPSNRPVKLRSASRFTIALLLLPWAPAFSSTGGAINYLVLILKSMNDTSVIRHNRVEEIVIVLGGLTLAVLSVLYQLWFG